MFLQKLFETVVEHIAEFSVDEDLLETLKSQQRRVYYNKAIKPRDLALSVQKNTLTAILL